MKIIKDIHTLNLAESVITVGSFDGIHLGHIELIKTLKEKANFYQCPSVVITFSPHPQEILSPKDKNFKLLTTTTEKARFLKDLGVDYLVSIPFNVEFSRLSANEYIEKFLVHHFHPKAIIIGYDHKFGLNRSGNKDFLLAQRTRYNFEIYQVEEFLKAEKKTSSTQIRKALLAGNIIEANDLLYTPYIIEGEVVKGKQVGTLIGFPTANLKVDKKNKLIPLAGVYAVKVYWNEKPYDGMLYIGNRPTFGSRQEKSIEVNIFDFDEKIYGERIIIEFHKFFRESFKYNSKEALIHQLKIDKIQTQSYFNLLKNDFSNKAIAVVILNYNGIDFLRKYIPKHFAHKTKATKIWVIDNNSTDESVSFLEKNHPSVGIVKNSKNHWFAGGYNLGLQSIEANYYLIVNSDVEPSNYWIPPLIQRLESQKNIGVVQPKILSYKEKQYFEYAGASGGFLDKNGYPFCRGRIFQSVEQDKGQYNDARPIFWASGAAFAIKKEIFENIGGFDEHFKAHMEEIDLCWRLQQAGFQNYIEPLSFVYHVGGGTLDYESNNKVFLNFRNSLISIYKNKKSKFLFFIIFKRLVLDGVAGVMFLLKGKIGFTFAILKAHFSFYGNLGKWKKRKKKEQAMIEKVRVGNPIKNPFDQTSILKEYYLSGVRHFSKLKK